MEGRIVKGKMKEKEEMTTRREEGKKTKETCPINHHLRAALEFRGTFFYDSSLIALIYDRLPLFIYIFSPPKKKIVFFFFFFEIRRKLS